MAEIRTRFPHGLPDWECTDEKPFVGESITWEQYREAFPPPQKSEVWELSKVGHLEEQERYNQALAWTAAPFADTILPFAAYLEPEGYAALRAMSSPVTKSYQRLVPRIYALAEALYDSLPQKAVWGQQERAKGAKAPWRTVTAGKWIKGKRKNGTTYRFPEEAMSLLDVLKALTDPDAPAVGNKDISGGANALVRHVRIDIDMAWTFREDGLDFHLADLAEEIGLVRRIYAAFGLTVYIFRTGNRGIQAVAPIPSMDRREASLLTECVRTVLAGTRHHPTRATDFQTSLDGLMRLPLGRHGLMDSLALFLGGDGLVLPPDQQVESTLAAFCTIPEMSMAWAEDAQTRLSCLQAPTRAIKADQLRQIILDMPDNGLVQTFISACSKFQVRDWDEVYTHTTPVLLASTEETYDREVPELCTHTTLRASNKNGD